MVSVKWRCSCSVSPVTELVSFGVMLPIGDDPGRVASRVKADSSCTVKEVGELILATCRSPRCDRAMPCAADGWCAARFRWGSRQAVRRETRMASRRTRSEACQQPVAGILKPG